MNRLEPKLRSRWKIDRASARSSAASVEKAIDGHRHPEHADRKALQAAAQEERGEVDVEVEAHQPDAGCRLQERAEGHADARIEARHRHGGKEADRRAEAARADDLADGGIGKAGMLLQQGRQQHDHREIQHAKQRDQQQADRVVAVLQQREAHERLLAGEAVRAEHVDGDAGNQGRDDDLGALEPVEALAAREHQLGRGNAGREADEAEPIEPRTGVGAAARQEQDVA